MESSVKLKLTLLAALCISGIIITYALYCLSICPFPESYLTLTNTSRSSRKYILPRHDIEPGLSYSLPPDIYRGPPPANYSFDINGTDVIVFLHIQKTSGSSFGRHLTHDMNLQKPCKCRKGIKRCGCNRPNSDRETWLFSRHSVGWRCGLHADFTELVACVDEAMDKKIEKKMTYRKYYYITVLREPVSRFLSEFAHVVRGATWNSSRHLCNDRPPTQKELPRCFDDTWYGVSLDEFLDCDSNLAQNRQTRMLSDLKLVGCYDKSLMTTEERDRIMLESAKFNLKNFAYFALAEEQKLSQFLFERTFKIEFYEVFEQYNTNSTRDNIAPTVEQTERIKDQNRLDIELYAYAKKLFYERVSEARRNFPLEYANFIKAVNGASKTKYPDGGNLVVSHRSRRKS